MIEFLHSVRDLSFMQNALWAGFLAAIACGVIGSYVVVRRIVFIGGGIAHAVLGGMGVAVFFGRGPLLGAVIAALAAALIIGLVSLRARQHEDTLIGALWAVGMALGIVFIMKTPGYGVDLMSYLIGGDILFVPRGDLYLIGALDIAILIIVLLLYRQFLAVCFDEEFARLQGVKVELIYLLLLCLIALTVVTLIRVVGLILVIALLSLPAAIAHQYVRTLGKMMVLASVLGFVFTVTGITVSYQPDLPAGATIILIAGSVYLLTVIGRGAIRHWRHRTTYDAKIEP